MVSFAGAHFSRGCLTCFGGCSHYVQGTGASPLLRRPALGMNSEFYSRVALESSRVQLRNFRNICTGSYSVPAQKAESFTSTSPWKCFLFVTRLWEFGGAL